jgi:hypothetical protein
VVLQHLTEELHESEHQSGEPGLDVVRRRIQPLRQGRRDVAQLRRDPLEVLTLDAHSTKE